MKSTSKKTYNTGVLFSNTENFLRNRINIYAKFFGKYTKTLLFRTKLSKPLNQF